MSVYGWSPSCLSRILTKQPVSADFSLAEIAQIQPGTKKLFVTSWEGPSPVGGSIEDPINVSNKECSNIDLKYQMWKKGNNKMKERKKVLTYSFFV